MMSLDFGLSPCEYATPDVDIRGLEATGPETLEELRDQTLLALSERGFAVVSPVLDEGALESEDVETVIHQFAQLLGAKPLNNHHRGPVQLLTPVEGGSDRPVSDTRSQTPHTDGGYTDTAPDLLLFYVATNGEDGGRSLLLPMHRVVRSLGEELVGATMTVARHETAPEVTKPFIDDSFDPPVVNAGGHEYNSHHLTLPDGEVIDQEDYLKMIIELLEPDDQYLFEPGTLVVVDNRQGALHGRTEITNNPDNPRVLHRLWARWGDGLQEEL